MEANIQALEVNYPLQTIYKKSNKRIFESKYGYLAYEEAPFSYVVAGDPVVKSPKDYEPLMFEFMGKAHREGKSVCGYYFSEEFKKRTNFKFVKVGTSGLLDLENFDLKGKGRCEIRRALNYGYQKEYKFKEISHGQKSVYYSRIKKLELKWLKSKMRPRVRFLLSSLNAKYKGSKEERWFVVENGLGHVGAFVTVFPYSGGHCFYIDQMLYNPDGFRLGLDFLISKLILRLKKEEAKQLSFGFNAFRVTNPQGLYEKVITSFWKVPVLYNSPGVYSFKSKFFDYEVPRYIMLDETFHSAKQFLSLGAVTFLSH